MTPWTLIATALAAAVGSAAGPAVLKFLLDLLLQRRREHHGREMAERQNAYSMGATSHMATVVFDRHIDFCEEYVAATSKALHALLQEGTMDPTPYRRDLFRIRQKWALWLYDELEVKLDGFEGEISRVIEAPSVGADGAYESSKASRGSLIAYLREILGTEDLTILRRTELAAAAAAARGQGAG